jgi:Na+/melibiose symporter-like transporter
MGLFFLVGACFGVQEVVIPAMIAKCADDSSRRTGVRTDGVIFSLLTFSTKVGLAFGAGLAGVALGWAGYVANAIEQSELVTLTISLLWTILPGTLCFIGAGLMTLFVKEW